MTKEQVVAVLKTVIDPELGLDIISLGLVYEVKIDKDGEDDLVRIRMTLTTVGCPLGGWFVDHIKEAIAEGLHLQEEQVMVEITFDPPWIQDMMSDEAKAELGFD